MKNNLLQHKLLQNKLKQLMKPLFALMLSAFLFTGCSKEEESYLGSLEVQLELKEGLDNISLEAISVKIINTVDNTESSLETDSTGKILFSDIPAGNYNISASKEFEIDNFTITGSLPNITIEIQNLNSVKIEINAVEANQGLIIKEVYYGGAADNYVSLFKDQFIEIFNNSGEVIYADGLYIANLKGETGASNHNYPITEVLSVEEYVYADFIDQIPGDGTQYPVAPGKSIVIALNAINFKEGNPTADMAVDNSLVDIERYSVDWRESQGETGSTYFDLDNPNVPNMTNIYMNNAVWLFNTYGTGVVIFRQEASFSQSDIITYVKNDGYSSEVFLTRINVDNVIDAAEFLENSSSAAYKRLPSSLDSGFNFLKADGGAFYSSKSMQRKIDEVKSNRFGRVVLKDSNNSGDDFESIDYPNQKGYNNISF